jgi:hypothetical protein
MRRVLIVLSITGVLVVALVVQALLDSALAAWIGFGAVFVLGIGWSIGLLPGGGSGLGGDD